MEDYKQIKNDAEVYFKSIGSILCPAIQERIYFNSDGFHHLRYDNSRSERSKQEQVNKMSYLKEAKDILEKTTTIQEYRAIVQPVGKVRGDGFRKTSRVEFYAFIAITSIHSGRRFKVIVRRVGDGEFHF